MSNNFRKIVSGVFLLSALFVLNGCIEGTVGSEGDPLLKYLPQGELETFVDTAIEKTSDECTALYDVADVVFEYPIWIVDVRTRTQFDKGHVPYARSYPYDMNPYNTSWMAGIPQNAYLIVYCENGGRAEMAVRSLEKAGYTRWMNWGGIDKWEGDLYKEVNDTNYLNQYYSASALKELVDTTLVRPNDPYDALYDPTDVNFEYPVWIVDTRPRIQYDWGHIPTAKSFPYDMNLFNTKWFEGIPKEVYLVLHCETGGRAEIARQSLIAAGYTRVINWGSVYRWPGDLVTD